MAGKIIWYAVTLGCAVLFYAIGIYARKIDKPMWFWSGTQVDAAEITDVEQYNKENGRMWQIYSLCYVLAGVAECFNEVLALVILFVSGTVGVIPLICVYNRIYKKYKKQ